MKLMALRPPSPTCFTPSMSPTEKTPSASEEGYNILFSVRGSTVQKASSMGRSVTSRFLRLSPRLCYPGCHTASSFGRFVQPRHCASHTSVTPPSPLSSRGGNRGGSAGVSLLSSPIQTPLCPCMAVTRVTGPLGMSSHASCLSDGEPETCCHRDLSDKGVPIKQQLQYYDPPYPLLASLLLFHSSSTTTFLLWRVSGRKRWVR